MNKHFVHMFISALSHSLQNTNISSAYQLSGMVYKMCYMLMPRCSLSLNEWSINPCYQCALKYYPNKVKKDNSSHIPQICIVHNMQISRCRECNIENDVVGWRKKEIKMLSY